MEGFEISYRWLDCTCNVFLAMATEASVCDRDHAIPVLSEPGRACLFRELAASDHGYEGQRELRLQLLHKIHNRIYRPALDRIVGIVVAANPDGQHSQDSVRLARGVAIFLPDGH